MALDTHGWDIDHSQNPALYKIADNLNEYGQRKQEMAIRQQEMNYRLQKEKEADDWKKMSLIRELSDIDKYQTGESVADALGSMKANDVIQKYTAMAGGMSPMELQSRVTQDIQNTVSGMQGFKDEITTFHQRLNDLKTLYPSLNTKALDQAYRADIINRRINGGDFTNPQHIEQSGIDINNPETLADFIPEGYDKSIREEIKNPKNSEDISVAMGNRDTYTKVKGKLPFYKSLNFTPQDIDEKGFLKAGVKPQMNFKSQNEKFGNGTLEALSPEAFKDFSPSATLEMLKQAKQMPAWKSMSNDEKDIALRHIALQYAKSDQSGFNFENANPPAARSTTNISMGGAGGGGDVRGNEFDRIDFDAGGVKIKGGVATETESGQPYSRSIRIQSSLLPAQVQAILKTAGIDVGEEEYFKLQYKDGKLQTITPESSGKVIDRIDMANAQKKWNSEPQKSQQPSFGERIDFSKLDPNGFKKEGNNYRYKDGKLFDAKGNLIKE